MSKSWTTSEIPALTGKRAIVTGGNSGIGWQTALELARAGAAVTIAARNADKADAAADRIRAALPAAQVSVAALDLASLASVRAFADGWLEDGRPLDLLIHNAGVMALPERRTSPDGHELQFATNVLGPFALTGHLLPRILAAAAPRVVTVSSYGHTQGGPTPIEDLDSERGYRPIRAYSKTKLANVLFTRELQRRAGGRLLAAAAHPGVARTNLSADTSPLMKAISLMLRPLAQTAAMGAEPTLRAATDPDVTPGGYYGPGGFGGMRGHPVEQQTAPFAHDAAAGRRLWNELERISGVGIALP